MLKSDLRRIYKEKRFEVTKKELTTWSKEVTRSFLQNFNWAGIKVVHVFLPIVKYNELNTSFLIREIRKKHPHIQLLTSVVDFNQQIMYSTVLEEGGEIIENKWGVPEPLTIIPVDDSTIDLIIVPLLAFDKKGNRIGYGKGFYDKFIMEKCRENVIKVGLSFFDAVDTEIADVYSGDVALDFAFTPTKSYVF